MELPNQDKIKTLGKKEIYKYSSILEADTIKKVEMKKKIKKKTSQVNQKASRDKTM